jgi:hypothetical protein
VAYSRTLSKAIIDLLLEIGRTTDFDGADVHRQLSRVAGYGWIDTRTPNEWRSAVSALSSSDIVLLAKTLALAEREFQWSGGSVSAVIWVFRVLAERDVRLSEVLADWILPRTTNPYVPFGHSNLGATSMQDYETRLRRRKERRAAAQQEAEAAAEGRRAQRIAAQHHRAQRHAARSQARREFLAELMQHTASDRLALIARDTRPLTFFPDACAEVDDGTLHRLGVDTREAVLQRLVRVRTGPWKTLRQRLMALPLSDVTPNA